MRVIIPGQLRSYTRGAAEVEMTGASLDEVLANLDAAFPGIRFRMIDELGLFARTSESSLHANWFGPSTSR